VATKRSASRSSRRDQRAGRFGSGLWCEKLIALPKAFCDTASVECQLMLQERGKADTPGSSIWTNNQQRSFVTKQCPRLPVAAVSGQTIETRISPLVEGTSNKTVSLRRNTLTSTVD
jgi:hypothetical protein